MLPEGASSRRVLTTRKVFASRSARVRGGLASAAPSTECCAACPPANPRLVTSRLATSRLARPGADSDSTRVEKRHSAALVAVQVQQTLVDQAVAGCADRDQLVLRCLPTLRTKLDVVDLQVQILPAVLTGLVVPGQDSLHQPGWCFAVGIRDWPGRGNDLGLDRDPFGLNLGQLHIPLISVHTCARRVLVHDQLERGVQDLAAPLVGPVCIRAEDQPCGLDHHVLVRHVHSELGGQLALAQGGDLVGCREFLMKDLDG